MNEGALFRHLSAKLNACLSAKQSANLGAG